ncbi:hypothetical protein Q9251_18205 [Alkalihalobacillus macyae]|uniref:nuclear transport factor 2 family protein n=1 Tax=Guptibacillus hwajinpoensis TaxID=208199 RepID=UPI00273B698E|nr:nuclear transport factor 2 family protein [Alkalihalobacillus macyae]MDP4552815.1 hypothetical protein [Alkalihalobacillus macyae]
MTSESHVLTQRQIAESFSNGNFDPAFPFLAKTIKWNIVGDKTLVGREAVIEECKQTSNYFKTITTKFTTLNVISEQNCVAVNGTAEFIRNGEQLSFVSACDVYIFNDKNELQKIDSYCIK